jgi:cystathionine beta-lyase/cystathionine gamma-synthase
LLESGVDHARHPFVSLPDALPLGRRIPGSPHSVSCSLPTLRAVVGYEEKDPIISAQIHSGYPRFVTHPFVREFAAQVARDREFSGRTICLTSSARMAAAAMAHVNTGGLRPFSRGDIHGVSFPRDAEVERLVRTFLQTVGGILSSRQAEDALVAAGVTARAAGEALFEGDAAAEIRRVLRRAYEIGVRVESPGQHGRFDSDPNLRPQKLESVPISTRDVVLAPSGMNAIHAAFQAVSELQASRGRTIWVQLGWLYLDTITILKSLTPDASRDYACIADVTDLPALERLFADHGSRIAAIVTEVPTNPLMQTADIAAVAPLARRHGALVVLDPTMASPFNVDVLGHADVVVNSLTKFAASEGDVIAGAVVINPAGADADALRAGVARHVEPVYARDMARLAEEIGGYEDLVARVNASTPRVAAFLESHPAVGEVYWSQRPETRANYLALARTPESVGAVVSFTLNVPLERFYDRVGIPKGPSFGMANSLMCPYLYLAHYDLVRTEAGRAELAAHGLNPALIRLSIGLEPPDAIIAALETALR